MKFSIWLEQKKDYVEDAILQIFNGNIPISDNEKSYLLKRNTNEFSNTILNRVYNLGLLRNKLSQNKLVDVRKMIKNGIVIKDLIDKINGEDLAPNAKI